VKGGVEWASSIRVALHQFSNDVGHYLSLVDVCDQNGYT